MRLTLEGNAVNNKIGNMKNLSEQNYSNKRIISLWFMRLIFKPV